jgi:PAS domain S-box-containing protein
MTIRGRLLLLAGAMLLPYLVLIAAGAYLGREEAIDRALAEQQLEAEQAAAQLGSHVERARALLAGVEAAVADDLGAEQRNDGRLRKLHAEVSGSASTLSVIAADGRLVASATLGLAERAGVNLSNAPTFRAAMDTRAFAVGAPARSPVTGEWVVVMARPILGPGGEPRAVTAAITPLDRLDEIVDGLRSSPEGVVVLTTEKGALLARAPRDPRLRGADLSGSREFRVAREGATFVGQTQAEDGATLYGASVPVPNAPWQVFVAVPASAALAPAIARLREQLLVALLMVFAAGAVAWWAARGVSGPIQELRRVVNVLAQGKLSQRVAQRPSGEIGDLAADFNRMAEELEQAEQRLRGLVALSSDWFWETDPDGRLTRIDGDAMALLGIPASEALGKLTTEAGLYVNGDVAAHLRRLEERRPFRDVEFVRLGADRSVARVLLVSGEPRLGSDGQLLGYRGVARDVTDRNRLEAMLRRVRERLQLVVDAVPAMLAYADARRNFVFVNRTYEELTGRSPAETVGRPVREVLGEEVFALIEPYMSRAYAGEHVEFERRHRRRDGEMRDLRIQYAPDRDASGKVQGIVGLVSDVTELKATQRQLAASEARFRSIAELSSDWIWETDAQHRFTFVSSGLERALDLSAEGVLGKARWELDFVDVAESDWSAHRAVLEAQQPFTDLRLKRRNRAGRVTYQSLSGRPVFAESGAFLGYRGIGGDITAQVEAEIALRAERDRLSHVLETMGEGLSIFDSRGHFVLINAAAERIFGMSRREVIGMHYLKVPWKRLPLGGDRASMPQESFERLRAGALKEYGPAAYIVEFPDGRQRIMSQHSVRLEDDKGRFAGVVATYEDITERVRSEGRNQLFLASSLDGYWMVDMEGRILEVNRALCELLGYEQQELVGASSLALAVGGSPEQVRERLEQVRAQGYARYETEGRRKDGTVIQVGASATYLPIEGGRVGVFYRDITERKRAEQALADSKRQIEELNIDLERRVEERTAALSAAYREMESFSYTVSHDLRAPLRAISGFSHVLIEDFHGEIPAEAQRLLARVAQNAERMGTLIDGLLEFGRLSRQSLRLQRLNPADVVREVVEEHAHAREGREVEIRIGDMPECRADRVLLKQVYANLISNALKFTRLRKKARIEVGAITMGLGPVYYVRDNGTGFDMQYSKKLFHMFERLHSPAEFEGNGVGLALVRRIIERHGGETWADSALDRGATFFFRLGDESAARRIAGEKAA